MAGLLDFASMAKILSAGGILSPIGDVLPFRRQSLDQNLYGTEGARPYAGGSSEVIPMKRSESYFGSPNAGPANYDTASLQAEHMSKVADATKKLPRDILDKIDEFSARMGSTPYQRGNAIIDAANMPAALKAWQNYNKP